MALYKVKIHTERLATGSNGKEAALAVLKDLEIDLKFKECPAIEISKEEAEPEAIQFSSEVERLKKEQAAEA